MEKISSTVDLLSLQRLHFYSPCHSQVENFLFHDNRQSHRFPGCTTGSLKDFPSSMGQGRENDEGATVKSFANYSN